MKRIVSLITAMILCLCLLSMHVFALSAAVTVSGPKSAQVGQTVKVTLNMTADGIYGLSGKLNYDSSMLSLDSYQTPVSDWSVEVYNNNFVLYDNNGEHPVDGTAGVLVLQFTILDAAAGSTVSVTLGNLVATDSQNDLSVGSVTYTCTVEEEEDIEPTTKPTTPVPPVTTEPATEPTEEATEPSQESTEETTQPTEETSVPTEETAEPTTEGTEPASGEQTGTGDDHCCLPWWLLILVAIVCLALGFFIGMQVEKKRNKK